MRRRVVRAVRKARVARLKARAAVLTAQRDDLARRLAKLENALTWDTSCLSCATTLDGSIAEYERAERAEELNRRYEDLLDSVELYINWRYVTKQLTTEQKELFATAMARESARLHGPDGPDPDPDLAGRCRAPLWWRDGYAAESPKPLELAELVGRFSDDRWGETHRPLPGADIEVGRCSACGGPAERGPSSAWWHTGTPCGRNTACFQMGD